MFYPSVGKVTEGNRMRTVALTITNHVVQKPLEVKPWAVLKGLVIPAREALE